MELSLTQFSQVIAKTLTPREQVDLVRELAKRIAAESGTSIEAWRGNDHERRLVHGIRLPFVRPAKLSFLCHAASTMQWTL